MPFPGVNINVENGNLLRSLTVLDGVGAIVATASLAGNINKMQVVYSLADAEKKGITKSGEPFLHKQISEFYAELGGNMQLYVYGTAETATMVDVVTSTNQNGLIKLLTECGGKINLVAIARKPAAAYNAGNGFLDSDVQAAVLASLPLCKTQQKKNNPVRLLIEGRIANEEIGSSFAPNQAGNGFVGVVLGGTSGDGSGAVSIALARAVKENAHVKIGSGQNGALAISQIYIGTNPIEERPDMQQLHDAGFITFQHRPGTAGYYFGRDNMCESGDYRILAHGRIIDKAQRVIAAAYTPYIETFIRIEDDGTLNTTDAKHLEDILLTAIRANMGEQISGAQVIIDVNQDIINTSTIAVGVKILPLGYLTWINVNLGLTNKID